MTAAPGAVRPAASGSPALVPVRLAWLLARRGSEDRATLLLPVIAFGAVTTLLLTVIAGAQSFGRWDDEVGELYQVLAVVAVALMLVPLITLGGSAARLSARRRDDRLATLRLVGATPATVAVMTVLESAGLALAGALGGVIGYVVLGPAVQQIPFRGEAIGSAYWLGPLAVVGVLLGVTALAAVSAAVGLRRVTISPLGVRTRQEAPRIGTRRLVVGVAVIGAGVLAMSGQYASFAAIVAVVLVVLASGLAVLNLIGPWAVTRLARAQLRRARTPARLIAARGIAESPKAVWRQVSSVAMTSFVAVIVGTGVSATDGGVGSSTGPDRFLAVDIGTGLVITVVASFLMVACSAGINSAAEILDRAPLSASLHKLGMPWQTLDEARTRTVMVPLVAATVGSALVAAVLILPLTGYALITAPDSLAVIGACLVAGPLITRLGVLATRPLLRRVVTS
ncbi:FtsX-like permease family protein [Georgenia faecalis]|uniref:FtsX-like permease family protein n=1 Tax=Georgenia faecalis TaxID=2483799 RepID=UPI000FD721F6|nr:FtsX-like permease family protein [Georgenia faecalis]